MAALDFATATLVSLVDPLLIAAYALAAIFTKNVLEAAMWGVFAGIVVAGVFMMLPGPTGLPRAPHVTFQWILACGVGAAVVRAALGRFRRPRAPAP